MPVKVYGTGGGKNTKDATAIPSDVRAGKTFYNAEGKQTGIWTPQATDYTGDADALPENVLNGKTFYNADGKQVGTLVEKVYSDFVFDADALPSDVTNGKVFYNNEGRNIGNAKIVKSNKFILNSSEWYSTIIYGLAFQIINDNKYGTISKIANAGSKSLTVGAYGTNTTKLYYGQSVTCNIDKSQLYKIKVIMESDVWELLIHPDILYYTEKFYVFGLNSDYFIGLYSNSSKITEIGIFVADNFLNKYNVTVDILTI